MAKESPVVHDGVSARRSELDGLYYGYKIWLGAGVRVARDNAGLSCQVTGRRDLVLTKQKDAREGLAAQLSARGATG